MKSSEVREIEHRYNLWGGYRDELIATAMTLSLVVIGSFIVVERFVNPEPAHTPETQVAASMPSQTLGVTDTSPPPAQAVVQPTPEPTPNDAINQVLYGEDGFYDFEAYAIAFRNPILEFDKTTNAKRKVRVKVSIKNKTVSEGIPIKIVGSIVKDGVIIVPAAVLYVSNPQPVPIGQEVTVEATLPLIEATDVRELKFTPGNDITEASHFLFP